MSQTTYLYVFGTIGGPFKVGYSNSPRDRAILLRSSSHSEFTDHSGIMWIQIAVPDETTAKRVEKSAHKILSEYQIRLHIHHQRSEWFDVTLMHAHKAIRSACAIEGIKTIEYSSDAVPSRRIKLPPEPKVSIPLVFPIELMDAITSWRAKQPGVPNKSRAIRMLIEKALASHNA